MALDKSALVYLVTIILAIGLVAAVFVKPQVISAENLAAAPVGVSGQQLRTLDVSADGSASADPNIADIFVVVETKADTADAAQAENADRVNRLKLAVQGSGLVKEITTTSFSVFPDFRYDPQTGESIPIGYRVVHGLKINTEKVAAVGKIIDVATANGASRIDFVSFSLSDNVVENLKKQALTNAANKAKDKAKTMASATSVSLGNIVHVSETSFFAPPVFFGAERFAVAEVAAAPPTQVVPGQIEVSATISITYEIV